ncbi:MAG: AMP-binding protein, partial [Caldilineaceae bacterium]|nr:AMP-binding protein [Caldilineaceae bacterium]
MSEINTLHALLAVGQDDAVALGAPGRPTLTYAGLRAHTDATIATLNGLGIGRNDRVAIVLPNGPLMASAFVSIGAGASTAPLNPNYREPEFEFYLTDLNAKALVVEEGSTSPAVTVAQTLNIPVLEAVATADAPAGQFELRPRAAMNATATANGGYAQPDDVALVLHTSGTTSRPKIVPLSHRNVCASA